MDGGTMWKQYTPYPLITKNAKSYFFSEKKTQEIADKQCLLDTSCKD